MYFFNCHAWTSSMADSLIVIYSGGNHQTHPWYNIITIWKRKKKKNTSLIIIIVIFNILWHAEFCNNIFAIYHPFQLQIISSKFNLSISVLCNSFFVFSALNVTIRQCLCCFIDTILPQKILRFDVVSNFSPPLLWACMHSILGPWLTHLLVALRVGYFLSPGQKKISEKNMLRQ